LQASEALYPIKDNLENSNYIGVNAPGFWLMRDSIILDTFGELIEQHNEEATILWWNLLKQIKRIRNKYSFNGVVLCVSAESLRNCNLEMLQQKGDNIRQRLHELSYTLNVQYPVYVLVTQCNKLENQESFFESFPDLATKQAMGKLHNIPNEEKQLKDIIGDTVHYIYEQLNMLRLVNLRHKDYLAKLENSLFFPEKLKLLKLSLTTLLQPVFRIDQGIDESRYAHLRGVFFTSVDVQKQKDKTNFKESAGYFLHELFTVILPSDK